MKTKTFIGIEAMLIVYAIYKSYKYALNGNIVASRMSIAMAAFIVLSAIQAAKLKQKNETIETLKSI